MADSRRSSTGKPEATNVQIPISATSTEWSAGSQHDWFDDAWLRGKSFDAKQHALELPRITSPFYPSLRLDKSSRDTSILQIAPGYLDSPIRCILSIHSLNDRATYDAFSYTRGASTKGLKVKANRKPFPVTDNLAWTNGESCG